MLRIENESKLHMPRLSKSDAEIIAQVRDSLWDSRGKTFETEVFARKFTNFPGWFISQLISKHLQAALVGATLMPENHPWRNLVCHYMGSPPLGLYPMIPTPVHPMKQQHLEGAIFGVAVPKQPLLSLLCSASPCRPGSGMIHQVINSYFGGKSPKNKLKNSLPKKSVHFQFGDFLGPPKYQGLFEKNKERTLAYTIT